MDLRNRVVLVTGGATGLGRAISLELARANMLVAINYSRSEDDARETMQAIEELGGQCMMVKGDVSSSEQVEKLVQEVVNRFGRLDAVVANAGTTVFRPFEDLDGITEEDWDRILGVNVKGVWFTAKAAAPYLKANGSGRIVITTSVAGIRPSGSSLPYSVSKAAANHLTKGLAKAMAPDVLVNAIAPGLLDTRWTRGHREDTIQNFLNSSPLKRVATLEDCARQVRVLIETDSMTGEIVVVDAGSSL
ncbi:SDR family oxidoreductase [Fodinisporobacter ferrooxydans]|uniref:SDR family oxidoreductase n=1 Tax=Fodinisporobacter ferrooxydans TaxID=2901836 RepID=A0ABY4CQ80_9BACL|nr:SDR family oxidoreductase [Alicyclobacillaceae bacterium MYW30-H2]